MNIIEILASLFRKKAKRSLSHPTSADLEIFAGSRTSSGVRVNARTSIQYSPVWAAISLISRDIAKLPINVFRRKRDGSRVKDTMHPADRILRIRPNSFMTPFIFKQRLVYDCALWGNSYAWIRRDGGQRPVELLPLDPARTFVDDIGRQEETGDFIYRTSFSNSEEFQLAQFEVFHLRGLGDGIMGEVVYQTGKDSLGQGIAIQEYSNRFFGQNVAKNLALIHPSELDDDAWRNLQKSLRERDAGLANAWKPWILEEGMKIQELGAANVDAQLKEMAELSVRDVANWWQIPSHKIGDPSKHSFNSLEEENKSYLFQTLDPWLCNIEEEAEAKLLEEGQRRRASHEIEFDRKRLMRANTSDMAAFFASGIQNGWMSPDEARQELGWNPIDDGSGEKYWIQTNLQPLDFEPPEEPEAPPPQAPPVQEQEAPEGNEEDSRAVVLRSLNTLINRTIYGWIQRIATRFRAEARRDPIKFVDFLEGFSGGSEADDLKKALTPYHEGLRALTGRIPPFLSAENLLADWSREMLDRCDCKVSELKGQIDLWEAQAKKAIAERIGV